MSFDCELAELPNMKVYALANAASIAADMPVKNPVATASVRHLGLCAIYTNSIPENIMQTKQIPAAKASANVGCFMIFL